MVALFGRHRGGGADAKEVVISAKLSRVVPTEPPPPPLPVPVTSPVGALIAVGAGDGDGAVGSSAEKVAAIAPTAVVVAPPPSASQPAVLKPEWAEAVRGHSLPRADLVAYLNRRYQRLDRAMALPMAFFWCAFAAALLALHFRTRDHREAALAVESALGLASVAELEGAAGSGAPGSEALLSWLDRVQGSPAALGAEVLGGARLTAFSSAAAAAAAGGGATEGLAVARAVARGAAGCRAHTAWDFTLDWLSGKGVSSSSPSLPVHCRSAERAAAAWRPWAAWAGSSSNSSEASSEDFESAEVLSIDFLALNQRSKLFVLVSAVAARDTAGRLDFGASALALDGDPVWLEFSSDGKERWGPTLFLDILLICSFLAHVGMELVVLATRLVRQGARAALQKVSCRKLLEFLAMAMLACLAALYSYRLALVRGLYALADGLPSEATATGLGSQEELEASLESQGSSWPEYALALDAMLEQAMRVADAEAELLWYATVLAGCYALRLFEAFEANPRLEVFVRTLRQVVSDMLHAFLLIFVVVAAFVFTGYAIFGAQLEAFSSPGRALGTALLFVFGRSFDDLATPMWEAGGKIGVVWVVLFFVTFVVILLGLVLALIIDRYTRVRAGAGDAPTLTQQVAGLLTERRRRLAELRSRAERAEKVGEPPPWPGAPPEASPEEDRSAMRKATKLFTDETIRRCLAVPSVHPQALVTSSSLSAALGADSWAERSLVDHLLERADAERRRLRLRRAEEVVSLSDGFRRSARACANAEDLGEHLAALAAQLVKAEEAENDALSCGASSHTDDLELWDLSPPPSPPPEEEDDPLDATALADRASRWDMLAEEAPAEEGGALIGYSADGLCNSVRSKLRLHAKEMARENASSEMRLAALEASLGELLEGVSRKLGSRSAPPTPLLPRSQGAPSELKA